MNKRRRYKAKRRRRALRARRILSDFLKMGSFDSTADADLFVTATWKRLSRQEQLQGLADRGVDTWEDYRGER